MLIEKYQSTRPGGETLFLNPVLPWGIRLRLGITLVFDTINLVFHRLQRKDLTNPIRSLLIKRRTFQTFQNYIEKTLDGSSNLTD